MSDYPDYSEAKIPSGQDFAFVKFKTEDKAKEALRGNKCYFDIIIGLHKFKIDKEGT